MTVFYKSTDNRHHKTDSRYKSPDNRWHYIKNVFYKSTDSRWHPAYTYRWVPGSWGTCSKECGGGTQTRPVTCIRNDGISRPDIFCSGVPKPALSQACNTHSCVRCVISNWNCNYCWSPTAVATASMTATADSTITTEDKTNGADVYIVGHFSMSQWPSGNNWGCGRCHSLAEIGYGIVNNNSWNGPGRGSASASGWVYFSLRYLAPEQLQNGFNFQVSIRVAQCHWDGSRQVCINSAMITKNLGLYPGIGGARGGCR